MRLVATLLGSASLQHRRPDPRKPRWNGQLRITKLTSMSYFKIQLGESFIYYKAEAQI